jgi:predicted TIM-barrel fold metal-dependent hydrolase
VPALGPIVDCNVHLWDQRRNDIFWLTDRTLLRDMMGDYDSLPDRYLPADYRADTAGLDVRGIVWSDAGAADPVATAEWVTEQDDGLVTAIVSLGDPADACFGELLDRLGEIPLVRSVRVRLAAGLAEDGDGSELVAQPAALEHLARMARDDLVVTVEANGDQVGQVARLARELPQLRIVLDHYGWPTDLSDEGRRIHLDRLAEVAAQPNVATRIDALGTIFGWWTTEQVRPWLLGVVAQFGPDRCMLGADLPIERLRYGFAALYRAYDEIFAEHSDRDREQLLSGTAQRWYGTG